MKIGPPNGPDAAKVYGIQQKLGKRIENAKESERTTDSFEPSTRIRELKELKERLQSISEVRQELVERLREEIAAGTYKPDPERIAAGIREELGLDRR
ncbi:MAG: flagellar biosynthesis anti-sigma factor FlgM [Ammonifex sp.]|jgi:negative regulator of flagellin synthesis FlgM|nr:MAG: flagellar biosynthesis anti-sigma factor FlgM [Ammonifex sp.]